ncbi:uroporphyrinogen-III synthase [Celerinatantimonas diazotrophica]|uniref:Uroporphyrinogen-III synthase n=1 Tax=Celerinatantimonas diazotrophica TaxID=412034 RepID=A0A4R1KF77_9GAMM|nr:uroporphyrinogen-III synthase [Celerinatantimonas diazotrophica]TCK63336.1 uroporphyrinogen-III synthase [Celerinatantimonas diazotrophica]CAG9298480.1 Uroporphyrinogen-III synthase [Celerinatantimonas diazotrophica]
MIPFNIHLLLTRPQPACSQDCQRLQSLGFDAKAAPLLAFEAMPTLTGAALDDYLAGFDIIIALSPRVFTFLTPTHWPNSRYIAIGQKTAKTWQACNLNVTCPEHANSESLLDMLQNQAPPTARILILRGETSRNWLPGQLTAIGFQVNELCCYRQIPQSITAVQFHHWQTTNINFIVCTSALQVSTLIQQAHLATMQDWLSECTLIVPSKRIIQMIDFPFRHVYNCGGAHVDALIDTLRSIV